MQSLQEIQKSLFVKSRDINEKITAVTQSLHYYSNEPNSVTSMITGAPNNGKRKLKEVLLKETLTNLLSIKKDLLDQQNENTAQINLLDIRKQNLANLSNFNKNRRMSLNCKNWLLPKDNNSKLLRGFGPIKDADTNVSWQNPGWLVGLNASPVMSCQEGKIVYSGNIPGRGHVIIIDHQGGYLATYAYLTEVPEKYLTKNVYVHAGSTIGYSSEKFYFEVRKDGVAINPQKVFSSKLIQNVVSLR